MDEIFGYFDVYLSVLSEYSVYLFVCAVLIFGFLAYFLSINLHRETFDSPKSSKKKPKKEKLLKTKNTFKDSEKIIKDDTISDNIKYEIIENFEEVVSNETEDNDSWIPIQKSKKISKAEKQLLKEPSFMSEENKAQSKCEKIPKVIDVPKKSYVQVETKVLEETEGERDIEEVVSEVGGDNLVSQISESPSSSLTDDFVLVDCEKSSSEEGVPMDASMSEALSQSGTSGASRKKNKKQQKEVSKQLVEAVVVDDNVIPRKEDSKKTQVAKRRRTRKDV